MRMLKPRIHRGFGYFKFKGFKPPIVNIVSDESIYLFCREISRQLDKSPLPLRYEIGTFKQAMEYIELTSLATISPKPIYLFGGDPHLSRKSQITNLIGSIVQVSLPREGRPIAGRLGFTRYGNLHVLSLLPDRYISGLAINLSTCIIKEVTNESVSGNKTEKPPQCAP